MRKSRFTEEQIIGGPRGLDAGTKIGDVIRRHGISQQTYHRRKEKYGALDVSEARRLKALKDENGHHLSTLKDCAIVAQGKCAPFTCVPSVDTDK